MALAIFGRARKLAGGAKKACRYRAALLHSRRSGGDSLGSVAGLFSYQRCLVARDRRPQAARIALLIEVFLVASSASLRRSADLDNSVHARYRRRALDSAVCEYRRGWVDRATFDSGFHDPVGDPGCGD